ncbi:MAG: hypothetical protein UY13_C0002G0106 [Candidatus Pacebacteria bacterium GW2011_GWB1_47_8]|nr:MAG: hypothetical protein UX28_C0001G0254 [Candidatus Pacebacteria bacterium GW2011_GWA1_46_10]KKU84194.1 MAG: hypothetical protein UY13_C0002G0106 [Candidatus Pacebacteria bacterium GW2011_GWB1_47_8]HCR81357.1 hypothetical protein [Candidatus Paceibacterota bacterium]
MKKLLVFAVLALLMVGAAVVATPALAGGGGNPTPVYPAYHLLTGEELPDYQVVVDADPFWIHQPALPEEGNRAPFWVEVAIEEGSYFFHGVACSAGFTPEGGESTVLWSYPESGNNMLFALDDAGTLRVTCTNYGMEDEMGPTGFSITAEEVVGETVYPAYAPDASSTPLEAYNLHYTGTWWYQADLPVGSEKVAHVVPDVPLAPGSYELNAAECGLVAMYEGQTLVTLEADHNDDPQGFVVELPEDAPEDATAMVTIACASGAGSGFSITYAEPAEVDP